MDRRDEPSAVASQGPVMVYRYRGFLCSITTEFAAPMLVEDRVLRRHGIESHALADYFDEMIAQAESAA